jgi:hypothetical protein
MRASLLPPRYSHLHVTAVAAGVPALPGGLAAAAPACLGSSRWQPPVARPFPVVKFPPRHTGAAASLPQARAPAVGAPVSYGPPALPRVLLLSQC